LGGCCRLAWLSIIITIRCAASAVTVFAAKSSSYEQTHKAHGVRQLFRRRFEPLSRIVSQRIYNMYIYFYVDTERHTAAISQKCLTPPSHEHEPQSPAKARALYYRVALLKSALIE
jgi:hypothetical protein